MICKCEFIVRLLNDVGCSGSELRLHTVRECDLEQQVKQSAQREKQLQDELTQMKDSSSHLQQQLYRATQTETSLKQQLQQSQKAHDLLEQQVKESAKREKRPQLTFGQQMRRSPIPKQTMFGCPQQLQQSQTEVQQRDSTTPDLDSWISLRSNNRRT